MKKLKEEMIKRNIYLRELSKKTNISIVKLSKINNSMLIPAQEEINKINEILHSSLTINDFEIEHEKIAFFEKIDKAFSLVYEDAKNKKKGSVICPSCNKRLSYVKHHNGHIWASCETENCISWMQ